MAVDSKHSNYTVWEKDWITIETLLAGERALKDQGETYLPRLTGQDSSEYAKYIQRSSLFNATSRTLQGLVGAVIRKEANINTDKANMELLNSITLARQSIHEVIRITVERILAYGFFGILVDMPPGENTNGAIPYLALYNARSILNWRTEIAGTEEKLVMLTLLEKVSEQGADEFEVKEVEQIRHCFIDPTSKKYTQQIYRKDEKGENWVAYQDPIIPVRRGISSDEIPFVFFNALSASPDPTKPPLLDLANMNIKHWQISADYYHGLHFCAMPTPWAAGFALGQGDLYIGAEKAWVTDNADAKCGFLEFTGQGLQALEKSLDKIEKLMAVIGARLLEEQKMGVEAARAIELRTSGDAATLVSIVSAAEEGIGRVMKFLDEWRTGSVSKTEIEMNRSFVSQKLTSQDLTALLQAVQAGQISQDTFLYNLQAGEVLPPDRTIEEEKKIIASEAPKEDFNNPPGGPGQQGKQFGNQGGEEDQQ